MKLTVKKFIAIYDDGEWHQVDEIDMEFEDTDPEEVLTAIQGSGVTIERTDLPVEYPPGSDAMVECFRIVK